MWSQLNSPCLQLWTGRLAMMGFLISIIEEFLTGRGTLAQVGRCLWSFRLSKHILGMFCQASHSFPSGRSSPYLTCRLVLLHCCQLQMQLMQPGSPSPVMLALLVVIFGGATLYGTAKTVSDARSKRLSPADVARYKSFLSLEVSSGDYQVSWGAHLSSVVHTLCIKHRLLTWTCRQVLPLPQQCVHT